VHLAVDPVAYAHLLAMLAHLGDVALEGVEIDDQAGRLDRALVHADDGRDVVADVELGDPGLGVHVSLPLSS
jgi:hypothetical protein